MHPNRSTDDRVSLRRGVRTAAVVSAMLACASTTFAVDYAGSVVASGLNSPRGLAFGPDGALYIAEAGLPGGAGPSTLVRGTVPSVYTETGSITRYASGVQTRIVTGLPSIYLGTEVAGPQDIAFGSNGTRYTVIGAGLNPAVRFTDLAPGGAGLGRVVSTTGSSVDVAAFETANNPAGGPLDSNPWHIVPVAGGVLVTDAGGNSLLRVGDNGTTSLLATFPARSIGGPAPSDSVPTGVAVGPDGAFYVGELTGFPFTDGAAQIYRVPSGGGAPTVFATGFTNITDLAFGDDGSLYVLEYDANGRLTPGDAGALIQLAPNGTRTTIFSNGLVGPTGLAIGPDGAFYVSNHSAEAGVGEVLRISAVPEPASVALLLAGLAAVGFTPRLRRAAKSVGSQPAFTRRTSGQGVEQVLFE